MTLHLAKMRAETLALIDGTTPGPWREGQDGNSRVYGPDGMGALSGLVASFCRRADARLVTASPTLAVDNLRLVDDNLRLLDENERLRGLIAGAIQLVENCPVETGICCCGDNMERHPSPMNCGHTPTDMGGYQALQWLDAARAALAEGGPDDR